MPAKKPSKKTAVARPATTRVWLTYPSKLIQRPIVWELSQKYPVVTNVRQASVSDTVGIVCLELAGAPEDIEGGIRWLKRLGVSVEPVELNAIAS